MVEKKSQIDLNEKYKLLSQCGDELICFVCEEWCKQPVRINKCGHYFCCDCIPKHDKCCPKCQEVFFQEDIGTVHWYDTIREYIQFFNTYLEDIYGYISNTTNLPVQNDVERRKSSEKLPFQITFTDLKSFKKNAKGESRLHIACKRKHLGEVRKLIEEKYDINSQDYACWTPLHEAVQVGADEIIKELLCNGALINSPGEFYVTPLHKAVIMENIDIIKLLVESGANREAIDYYGRKPYDCTKRKDLLDAIHNVKVERFHQKPQIFVKNSIIAYCHSIDEKYRNKFLTLKSIKIVSEFDIKKQDISHLIVKSTHKISFKILLCLVGGLYIIRQEWVEDILKGNIDFLFRPVLDNFAELNEGIRKAIFNRLLNKPHLFHGIKFYLEGPDDEVEVYRLPITKDFLRVLISSGGGVILKRAPAPRTIPDEKCFPYHGSAQSTLYGCNNIIIFNENHPPKLQYNMRELQHKSCKWLIDCVINFELS